MDHDSASCLWVRSSLVTASVPSAPRFKFRVLLEESMSFGTLGATGRGCCEHHLMKSTDVTLICGSM
eukprot:1039306-Rhodomonas_salina.2